MIKPTNIAYKQSLMSFDIQNNKGIFCTLLKQINMKLYNMLSIVMDNNEVKQNKNVFTFNIN